LTAKQFGRVGDWGSANAASFPLLQFNAGCMWQGCCGNLCAWHSLVAASCSLFLTLPCALFLARPLTSDVKQNRRALIICCSDSDQWKGKGSTKRLGIEVRGWGFCETLGHGPWTLQNSLMQL